MRKVPNSMRKSRRKSASATGGGGAGTTVRRGSNDQAQALLDKADAVSSVVAVDGQDNVPGAADGPPTGAPAQSMLMEMMSRLSPRRLLGQSGPRHAPQVPFADTLICRICLEDGQERECCKQPFCDYCYVTKQACPSCGTALDQGRPVLIQAHTELQVKEVLECRRCLRPGYRRKCCQEYYCNDCYYATGFCPSCRSPVVKTGMTELSPLEDPGWWAVFWSYTLTFSFVLGVLAFALLFLANDLTLPKTVSGFTCYGIRPSCTNPLTCVAWDSNAVGLGNTEGQEGVPNMTSWRACDASTPLKLVGRVCVFDEELYRLSGGTLGYDFCAKSFENGVLYFHDDFETWRNSSTWRGGGMGSAQWANIVNGRADRLCGVGQGNSSLHFGGRGFRYAETVPLDMTYGGLVKFQLAFGSQSNNIYTSACKPAFSGNVRILFSVDGGSTWLSMAEYPVARYSEDRFYSLQAQVPAAAFSSATRFRFQQSDFDELRDHWAIDDVRIVHQFPPGWKEAPLMKRIKAVSRDYIHQAQCCYRTLQCQTWRLNQPLEGCDGLPNYSPKGPRPLHGVELFTLIVFVVSMVRSLYNLATSLTVLDWLEALQRGRKVAADKPPPGLLSGTFRLRIDPTWQIVAMLTTLGPLVFLGVLNAIYLSQQNYLLSQTMEALDGLSPDASVKGQSLPSASVRMTGSVKLAAIYVMALYVDLKDVYKLLAKIVCILPKTLPVVEVDATPHINTFKIGSESICLDDVSEITRFSLEYSRAQAVRLVLGAQPYTSAMLFMGLLHVYFPLYRVLRFVGLFLAVVKAFYGPEWIIKLTWALGYLFAMDARGRDELGLQLKKRKIWIMAAYWAALGAFLSLVVLSLVKAKWAGGGFLVGGLLGAVFGLCLGIARGLPVVPFFVFTTVDTGVYIRVTRKKIFPCLYRSAPAWSSPITGIARGLKDGSLFSMEDKSA